MKKQFIFPTTHLVFLPNDILTLSKGDGPANQKEIEAPARGKTPLPSSVNQVLSQTADQK